MDARVITPYAGTGVPDVDPYRPLIADVFGFHTRDDTGRQFDVPGHNLMLSLVLDITGAQLSQIKSDDRFFVLEPGPGYNGSALQTWLNDKGATDNPVTGNETAEEATSKLRGYFKEL